MKISKAPGIHGIPVEVFKHGGTLLKENLLKLIQKCWKEHTLPQGFKDAVLIPIFTRIKVTDETVETTEEYHYCLLQAEYLL